MKGKTRFVHMDDLIARWIVLVNEEKQIVGKLGLDITARREHVFCLARYVFETALKASEWTKNGYYPTHHRTWMSQKGDKRIPLWKVFEKNEPGTAEQVRQFFASYCGSLEQFLAVLDWIKDDVLYSPICHNECDEKGRENRVRVDEDGERSLAHNVLSREDTTNRKILYVSYKVIETLLGKEGCVFSNKESSVLFEKEGRELESYIMQNPLAHNVTLKYDPELSVKNSFRFIRNGKPVKVKELNEWPSVEFEDDTLSIQVRLD